MAFSLRSLFKRKEPEAKTPPPPPAVVDKPSSDRFSKTVMPNATRVSGAPDPFAAASSTAPAPVFPQSVPAPAQRPTIAMNAPASHGNHLPPAVAVALDPKVERALPFVLADVVAEMPPGFVRALSNAELNQRILLKAAELERGMANGKPTVSIATVYDQVPEIFVRPVAPSDTTQVALPFIKVLEQFTSVQMRADQHPEHAVPQVETPFLQVTLEDDKKFGTTTRPLMADSLPPVRVLPATAESIAAAEPEPAAKSEFVPPSGTPAPAANNIFKSNGHSNGAPSAPASNGVDEKPAAAPTRIPFKLTPNGAGAPAAERVPASSGGASVPTSSPKPAAEPAPAPAAPTRIPFKLSTAAPKQEEAPAPAPAPVEAWLTKDTFSASADGGMPTASAPRPAKSAKQNAPKILLPLKPILEGLPPFQLTGDISVVPADTRVEFPFSLVEPQLASGRVTLSADDFAAALPEKFRSLFSAKEIAAPISLPLQDVLQNLPAAALRMRDDQEEQERGANYATPFAATAEEDAKRFKTSLAPLAKPVVEATPEPAAIEEAIPEIDDELEAIEPEEEPAPAPPKRTALQEEFHTDDSLDPRDIVTQVEKIAGVKACALLFGDGLNLAGSLPEKYETEGLCAMAPSMMQRVENHLTETKLGALRGMTLSCTAASVTFFMHDNLCLAALHEKSELPAESRARLDRIVRALSETYSQPA
ncbi:MAG: hypothetical protein M3032_03985 [Verrucomicrobiota bacterium]|nr:hypothetical protein [Verrucomicrobiota bacterium]